MPTVVVSRRSMVAGAAVSGMLLAACAGTSAPAPAAPKAADLKGVTLEHWIQNALTHPEGMAKEQVMQNFTAQNQYGISVTSSGGQNIQKVIAAVAADTPPDLVDGFHFNMSGLFRQGATVDLDAELKANDDWKKARANLYPEILNGFTWKGKTFAVPAYSSYFNMYYQPEHLKRAGLAAPPPKTWTWEQFLDYCKKAARPPDVTGYDDQWSYSRTGMMVLNNGGRMLSPDGTKFIYNSPEAVEALEFQQNMINQGLMRAHDGSANGGYSEKLAEAKVVFQFAVAARVQTYRKNGTQFGTCFYPIGPKNAAKRNFTHGESYGFAVFKNKDPKKQQAALLAALWGARPDSALVYATTAGTIPSYKNAVEAPDFQATFKKDPDTWAFYEILPNFVPMPNFPGFTDVRSLGDSMIRDIWAGKTTIRDGLNEYTRQGQIKLDEVLK